MSVVDDRVRSVADAILRDATKLGLHPGSRLATERALAENLEIPRSLVRHAMSLLEAEGAVSREVGRGTYLRRDPLATMVDIDSDSVLATVTMHDVSPADVMAARLALEPMAMYLATEEATESDFEAVGEALAGCGRANDYDEFEHWDLAFHRSLIEATHNPLVLRMYSLIEVARQGDLWGSLKRRHDTVERRRRSAAQHEDIARALHNRDGFGAQEAMTAHLDFVSDFLRQNARR